MNTYEATELAYKNGYEQGKKDALALDATARTAKRGMSMQTGIVGEFQGYPLYATTFCADLVQARKHKKKRINKKWLKRYGMRAVPWKKVVLFDGKIYGHPTMIDKIIEAIAEVE